MQPTNKSERRKALLNFMLLFLVCSGIIITTVFFSTRIPLKQNNQLLEFKNATVKNDELKRVFSDQFIVASKMVDDLGNKTSAEIKAARIDIKNKIDELSKLIADCSAEDKILYQHVLRNLDNYYTAKETAKEGLELSGKDKNIEDQISELRARNEQLYKSLEDCRKVKP